MKSKQSLVIHNPKVLEKAAAKQAIKFTWATGWYTSPTFTPGPNALPGYTCDNCQTI